MIAAALAISGCADRYRLIEDLAGSRSWRHEVFGAGGFHISGYLRPAAPVGGSLAVYLEGDGRAFITRRQISSDPTPDDPTAFRLAMRHPPGAVLYLARPCQYVRADLGRACDSGYWTSARYAPEIVEAVDAAIGMAKAKVGASTVALYGYSGGGAIAALVAARRTDVERLVTVAGNLDHAVWTAGQGLTPLSGSLNPADLTASLVDLPQLHFAGGRDEIVPPYVARSFIGRFPQDRRPPLRVLPEHDHDCCWVESWADLVRSPGAR